MPESDHRDSILERIIAGTHSDADIWVLRQALQEGQLALATGERAVAVGGDVNDTVIVTGDGNVVRIFKGPDAETIRQIFQQVVASLVPQALLTHAEFSARAEQASLVSHQGPLAGREAVIKQFRAQLAGPARVVLLHGPGGIGDARPWQRIVAGESPAGRWDFTVRRRLDCWPLGQRRSG